VNTGLGIGISLTVNTFLLQSPVPNYTDVDLSFSYRYFHSVIRDTKSDLDTPYKCTETFLYAMTKTVENQLSSPLLQELIRFVQPHHIGLLCSSISCTHTPYVRRGGLLSARSLICQHWNLSIYVTLRVPNPRSSTCLCCSPFFNKLLLP
jgi:hypothetical protein